MGHIHTGPGEHDFTSSGFIIRTDTPEPTLMLHRHKILGVYLQFGGHVEINENLWAAMEHELREESGYEFSQLKLLQPKHRIKKLTRATVHPVPACMNTHEIIPGHFHTDLEFAFTASGPPTNEVAEGESEENRLFTRSQLAKAGDDITFANFREIGDFIFAYCLDNWEEVDPSEYSTNSRTA